MNKNLSEFTEACIEALYFTETGDTDQPDSDAKMDEDTKLDLEADCRSWWRQFGCYVVTPSCFCSRGGGVTKSAQAGHDFWMTRNGHGVGFDDGDWSDNYADVFTKGSIAYGLFDVIKGDDGKIYS
jgi:hypothetical protein